MNLIYLYFNFFKNIISKKAAEMDRREPIFDINIYGYVKTRDMKHMSIGNLEQKFTDNMTKILESLYVADYKEMGIIYEEEDNKRFAYSIDSVSKIFSLHNRDELFDKYVSKK